MGVTLAGQWDGLGGIRVALEALRSLHFLLHAHVARRRIVRGRSQQEWRLR
jgi:hypothetical protein